MFEETVPVPLGKAVTEDINNVKPKQLFYLLPNFKHDSLRYLEPRLPARDH